MKSYVPFWFLPLLHQDYSNLTALVTGIFFFSFSLIFHTLNSVYYIHYFVSENGNDSSVLLLTPLIHLQMTSALPLVAALHHVSSLGQA